MSRTKRIRIAVCMHETGLWFAYGINDEDDETKANEACSEVTPDGLHAVSFIEVDVPLPDPPTIEGRIFSQ